MMYPVSPEFLAAVATGGALESRVSILDGDLNLLLGDVAVESAPVQLNASIARRTATVTLGMTDAIRALISDAYPWRIERGKWINGVVEWVPVFTGWPDEDEETLAPAGSVVTIPFRGRERLADEATFEGPVTFRKGMRLAVFARSVCEAAGMGTDDALYEQLDDGGRVLAIDHGYEEEVAMLATLDQVTRDHGLDFAADPLSLLVMRPFPDVETAAIVADYGRGPGSWVPVTSFRRKRTRRPKNRFVVIGTGGFRPVRAELTDQVSLDAGVGLRLDKYTSAGIATQQQANDVCLARFRTRGSIEEEVTLQAPPNPALDLFDVISVTETRTGTAGRFLVYGLDVPDALTAQTLTTRVVKPFLAPVSA